MKHLSVTIWLTLCSLAAMGCISEQPTGLSLSGGGTDEGGTTGTTQQPVYFRPEIQLDLDGLGCTSASCHGGASLPMPLVAQPIADEDWRDNYDQVKTRSGNTNASALMDKARGDGGHIAPMHDGDPTVERWLRWIAQGSPYSADGGEGGAGSGGDTGGSGAGGSGSGGAPTGELSWGGDIFPMVVANACLDCHGVSGWQGAYSLASYQAALGFGSDATPNVIPGDPSSKLVEYTSEGHHEISPQDALVIRTWVVDWEAQP